MNANFTKETGKSHWTVKLGELMVWEDLLGTSGSKEGGTVAAAAWMKGVSKESPC